MKSCKYLSELQKINILRAFKRLCTSGFKKTSLTKDLYRHLICNFGFIAHYNIHGFYEERFENPQGLAETFKMILSAHPNCFEGDFGDINKELYLVAKEYAPSVSDLSKSRYKQQLIAAQERINTELARLE